MSKLELVRIIFGAGILAYWAYLLLWVMPQNILHRKWGSKWPGRKK